MRCCGSIKYIQEKVPYANAKYFNPEVDVDIEPVLTDLSDSIWKVDDEVWEEEEGWQDSDKMRNASLKIRNHNGY